MGIYKNTNDHPVRYRHEDGRLLRVPPNTIVEVEGGKGEESLKGLPGVESASGDDLQQQRDEQVGVTDDDSRDTGRSERMDAARRERGLTSVVEPLQEVIGDSDAPYGPDNGVITTKQALAQKGGADKQAFADHEALPQDAEKEGVSDIHRRQAENQAALAEVQAEDDKVEEESGSVETPSEQPRPGEPPTSEQPTVEAKRGKGR